MWTGAILAGGQSRRLGGRNKARLTLAPPGGASVLDRQLARLSRVVDRTIIVANGADAYCGAGVRDRAAPAARPRRIRKLT